MDIIRSQCLSVENQKMNKLVLILIGFLTAGAAKKPAINTAINQVNSTINLPGTPITGIHFSPVTGYSQDERDVLVVADRLVNETIQSQCFKSFMLQRKLIQAGGQTNAQVVDTIQRANLTLPVQAYYANNNVVGYRQPPSNTIYTNRKFTAGANACDRASNLLHETTHTIGYIHDFNPSQVRPYSIPYSTNAAVAACCSCTGLLRCVVKP